MAGLEQSLGKAVRVLMEHLEPESSHISIDCRPGCARLLASADELKLTILSLA